MTRASTSRTQADPTQDSNEDREREDFTSAPCVRALRAAVSAWRQAGYIGTTKTTKYLLEHWFFQNHSLSTGEGFAWYPAQREAIETLIFLWECQHVRDQKTLRDRFSVDQSSTDPLMMDWSRYAIKMATGSGKTKVMSLAIVWQYLNAVCEETLLACSYARTFLLLSPNIIVFERLKTDFGDGRIFQVDPLVPPELKGQWDLAVVERGDRRRISARGVLIVTNIQQLYERRQNVDEPDPIAAVLGRVPPATRKDASALMEQIAGRSEGPLMVLNDEAHHAYPGTDWHETIVRANRTLPISIELDFSATPRLPNTGTVFPWTVYDYPLRRAIQDGVVKRPVRGIARVDEVDSDSAAIRYAGYLAAGFQRWKEYCSQLVPLGKQPILFIMATNTQGADEVAAWLRANYSELAGDRTLVIHTKANGDISDDDQETARRLARAVDNERSAVRAVVSVLMLREGWDVSNVTVVVGLRPFNAQANILPEQAIGRGLRRMFRSAGTAIDERVDIIGTPGLMKLLDQLEQEESFRLETVEIENNRVAVRAIKPVAERRDYDLGMPVFSARYVHTDRLNDTIETFDVRGLPLAHFDTIAIQVSRGRFTYEAYDLLTGLKEFERDYPLPDELAPRDVIAFCARHIGERIHAPTQFSALAAKVKKFYEHVAFRRNISIDEPGIRDLLCNPATAFATVDVFARALSARLAVEAHEELVAERRLFSFCPPFPWTRASTQAQKTVFDTVACDDEDQELFVKWLDNLQDVEAFARIPPTFGFSLQYLDPSNRLVYFIPHFAVRQRNGTHVLVEFGGSAPHPRDAAIQHWCDNATSITGTRWLYVKLTQREIIELRSGSFRKFEDIWRHRGTSPKRSDVTPTRNAQVPAKGVGIDDERQHFLNELYELCAQNREQRAVERFLVRLEADLREGRFPAVDAFMELVEVNRLAPAVLLATLSITLPAKQSLAKRAAFLVRVDVELRRCIGDERAHALLARRQ